MTLDLPRLDQRRAIGTPVPKGPTRLEAKTGKDRVTEQALEQWRRKIRTRDRFRCRHCQRKVVVTLELQPARAECNHIAPRSREKALRTDVRNGILFCFACHQQFTRKKLIILQKAALLFTFKGQTYIDGNKLVTFKLVR